MSEPPPLQPAAGLSRWWVARIVVSTLAVFVVVAVVTVLFRPSSHPAPSAGFDRQFLGACTRGGVEEARCRCAYDQWLVEVDDRGLAAPGSLGSFDDALADGGEVPAALAASLAGC